MGLRLSDVQLAPVSVGLQFGFLAVRIYGLVLLVPLNGRLFG